MAWSPQRSADLELVARLLGLPPSDVDQALAAAKKSAAAKQASAVNTFSTAGIQLSPGDRVAFTGEMALDRAEWERRCGEVGLRPAGVAKSTKILVAADPNSLSGKAATARAYGIPIITEEAFDRLIGQIPGTRQ